jgi:hypothetical protein
MESPDLFSEASVRVEWAKWRINVSRKLYAANLKSLSPRPPHQTLGKIGGR